MKKVKLGSIIKIETDNAVLLSNKPKSPLIFSEILGESERIGIIVSLDEHSKCPFIHILSLKNKSIWGTYYTNKEITPLHKIPENFLDD